MGELKGKISSQLGSAHKWLSRAEKAFASEKDTRGKLDLMLAEAELQHIREATIKGKTLSWGRQVLAFSLAAIIMSGGIGGAYWYMHRQPSESIQPRFTQSSETKPLGAAAAFPAADPAETRPVTIQPIQQSEPKPETRSAAEVNPVRQNETQMTAVPAQPPVAEKETAMNQIVQPEEMQKLIREAGKSLRGQ